MNSTYIKIIAGAAGALIVGVIIGFFLNAGGGYDKGYSTGIAEGQTQGVEKERKENEARTKELENKLRDAEEQLRNSVPKNSAVNPYKTIYTNPFDKIIINPFE